MNIPPSAYVQPEIRANPNALGLQLIIEFEAAKERILKQGGGQRAPHFEARTEGTQDTHEIVKQLSDREMAGLYLAHFRAAALSKWDEACRLEPFWRTKCPTTRALVAQATESPTIIIP